MHQKQANHKKGQLQEKKTWNFPACLIFVLLVEKNYQLIYGPKRDTNRHSKMFRELAVKSKTKPLKNNSGVSLLECRLEKYS